MKKRKRKDTLESDDSKSEAESVINKNKKFKKKKKAGDNGKDLDGDIEIGSIDAAELRKQKSKHCQL